MKSKLSIIILIQVLFLMNSTAQTDTKKADLETLWKEYAFSVKGIPGFSSMRNGKSYTLLELNRTTRTYDINQYSYSSGKLEKVLLKSSELSSVPGEVVEIESYELSPDENYVLISTNSESIYRHSSMSLNSVYDLKNKKNMQVCPEKIMHASFSPDSKKLAYVKSNNLWYFDIESAKETAITNDGEQNKIINGSCDWVYEEEFSFTKAFFWSPAGDKIAYYRFDESGVKEYSMPMYGEVYPKEYKFKYPKAGEDNSKVSIHYYNLQTKRNIEHDFGQNTDFYVPRIKWSTDNDYIVVYLMNRLQNRIVLQYVNANTGASKLLLTEESKTYVDVTDNLYFSSDKKYFIWSSERDGYNHLYLFNMNGSLEKQITQGKWDIDDVCAVDDKKKVIYYTSSEVSPMERHLYSIGFDGSNKKKLSTKKGYHSIQFNGDKSMYVDISSDLNSPPDYILYSNNGQMIRVLESNQELKNKLGQSGFSRAEFINVSLENDVNLNGWLIKPANFDVNKKYPVLMYVYGGPGSQTVTDRWGGRNYVWFQYLAQNGYVVVSVDNRGTGFRGEAFKKCTYLQLGAKETEDQIATAKYLAKLPYVDPSRIGIFGWSYGGYMSSLCITLGADVFKTAVAVAPVTNWRYYDNIYTERFMRTPKENGPNYDGYSPLSHVQALKGNYLIIHGTADDNVHLQNSMDMINAMIRFNKKFDSEVYPNRNHGISGNNANLHIFNRISDFIFKNL